MQRDDWVYVGDMYDFAEGIARRAKGLSRDAFDADEDLRLALVQLLSWIGVAARRVSPEFQAAHPEIPWGLAIGMRNILAHDYFNVDWDLVYKTSTVNIPELFAALIELLPSDAR
jgi:uncharacterized protein with HEPN domain